MLRISGSQVKAAAPGGAAVLPLRSPLAPSLSAKVEQVQLQLQTGRHRPLRLPGLGITVKRPTIGLALNRNRANRASSSSRNNNSESGLAQPQVLVRVSNGDPTDE
jgi:RNase P protein component